MSGRGNDDEARVYDEAFLFHLSRGSEFLVRNRMEEAREELERALEVQPRDAKGQDLLASAYFRLGLYPRAIELWSALVAEYAEDVSLRVNLGLVLLKTAQLEEAVRHLRVATALDEGHARAFRYLGLALYRLEKLEAARDAFLRGGEVSMAERMDELLGTPVARHVSPSLSVRPPAPVEAPHADEPQEAMPGDGAPPRSDRDALDDRSVGGGEASSWVLGSRGLTVRAVGEDAGGAKAAFILHGDAVRVVAKRDPIAVRRADVIARRGCLVGEASGAIEGLGEARAIVERGAEVLLRGERGGVRTIVEVAEDDVAFILDTHLLAFTARSAPDVRAVDVGSERVSIVALEGPASFVLETARRPLGIATRDEPVRVERGRLIGWSGRFFPRADGDALALTGEGTVVVA